jgi:spore germination protein YaaH
VILRRKKTDNLTMKLLILIILPLFLALCTGTPASRDKGERETEAENATEEADLSAFIHEPGEDLPITTFREIWGYVVAGQEAALTRDLPITDVGYFGAEVNMYGTLSSVPRRQNLSNFSGRVHLVVTSGSNALTYFALMPGSHQRRALIADLIAETRNFDGLNIDFENIPPRSGEAFLSFLRELRAGLPDKVFSVALYARTRPIANDVYDYEKIRPYVDRIFVMAYDEHWGGSRPGPISSITWCRRVAEHSLRVIGPEKLVMGIPFYGRAWVDHNHHRAHTYPNIQRLIDTHNVTEIRRENGTPTFRYNPTISVTVFYEDEYSISARFEMYKAMGVNAIGFWRIGQETPRVWDILRLEQ